MPDYESYEYITVENREHDVAVVTLNRPDRRNAINNDMHTELERLWVDIGGDESIRAIVLTGAGKSFCSGGDATSMDDGSFLPSGPATPFRAVRTLMHNMLEVEQPVVTAVNGDAAGLGATIALCCDIIVSAADARFADMHTKMGLVAGDGGVIICPIRVSTCRFPTRSPRRSLRRWSKSTSFAIRSIRRDSGKCGFSRPQGVSAIAAKQRSGPFAYDCKTNR